MQIFVEELKYVDNDIRYMPVMDYESDIIPKKDEILYFPHFGLYIVKDVVYMISDDRNNNKVMWIELKTDKI